MRPVLDLFSWHCDQQQSKNGNRISGMKQRGSLETFFKWSTTSQDFNRSRFNKITIIKTENENEALVYELLVARSHHRRKESPISALTKSDRAYWECCRVCSRASYNHRDDFCSRTELLLPVGGAD
jgi:hypothetical protein